MSLFISSMGDVSLSWQMHAIVSISNWVQIHVMSFFVSYFLCAQSIIHYPLTEKGGLLLNMR